MLSTYVVYNLSSVLENVERNTTYRFDSDDVQKVIIARRDDKQ